MYCNFLWMMLRSLSRLLLSEKMLQLLRLLFIVRASMSHTARKAPKRVNSFYRLWIIQHQRVKTIWMTCNWIIMIKCVNFVGHFVPYMLENDLKSNLHCSIHSSTHLHQITQRIHISNCAKNGNASSLPKFPHHFMQSRLQIIANAKLPKTKTYKMSS